MTTFISPNKKWKLEWEDIGEGRDGDYNQNAPDDVPHLRANLFQKVKGKWVAPEDSSYCTLAPVYTDRKYLKAISEELFASIGGQSFFHRRLMERWTWRTNPKDYL